MDKGWGYGGGKGPAGGGGWIGPGVGGDGSGYGDDGGWQYPGGSGGGWLGPGGGKGCKGYGRDDKGGYGKGAGDKGYGPKGGCKGKGGKKGGDKGWFKGGDKGDGKKGGLKGKAATKIVAGETVYSGQIKSFSLEKKHGYIMCEAIYNICGQDVYAFQDVLERGRAGPGDTVAFFVHWSQRGQPQASSPLIRLSAPEAGYSLKGTFKAGKDADKGFGFIECAETKEFFGRDVYVNKDLAATVIPGQLVAFSCYLNRDGMPNAQAMEPCEESWEAPAGDLSVSSQANIEPSKGKGGSKGMKRSWGAMDGWGAWGGDAWGADAWGWGAADWWGMGPPMMALGCMDGAKGSKGNGGRGKGGWSGGGASRPIAKPTPTGKAYTGVIKSFNEANNYGFIECEEVKAEYGFDVFVHGKELCGQMVGETVYFEVGVSNKGQPQALNVQSMDAAGVEPPVKKQKFGEDGASYGEASAPQPEEGAAYPEGVLPEEYQLGGYGEAAFPFQDMSGWGHQQEGEDPSSGGW